MKTKVRLLLSVGTAFALLASASFSQPPSNIEVKKLNDNFYRLTSQVPYPSNFLAYVCPDGILLVDAGQKETGQELKRILKTIAVGNAEVKYLINTHAHIDHTGGNLALAGEPLIIGSEILRPTLRTYSYVLYEFPDKALPSITFSDSMTLYFGDEKIRIFATPGSHDATDVIVHFTKAGIVCLGDISYGMTFPSLDGYTGNLLNYPKVIDRILTLIPDNVTIVSGHGRETSVEELKQYRNMIVRTTQIVKEQIAKGKDVATMQKDDVLKDWASYDGGIAGNHEDWIDALAGAGPSKLRGSLAGELYQVLINNDADAAIAKYYELKKNYPNEYPFDGSHIIRTGNWLLNKERTSDAIKLFELFVKEFPGSVSGYASLGEAYIKAGNKELAIKNYEKVLEISPKNGKATETLKQLRSNK
jgi:cyclase